LTDRIPLNVTRKLSALGVRCPTCDSVVARGTLDVHVQDCPLECERGCGTKVTPAQRVQHDGVCGALESPCTAYGCAVVLPRSDLAAHRAQCALVAIEPATRSLLVHLETTRLRCAESLEERFAEHTRCFAARLEEQEKRFFQLQTHVVERLEEVARAQASLLIARLAEHERRLIALEDRVAHRTRACIASEPAAARAILREKRNSRNLNSQDSSS